MLPSCAKLSTCGVNTISQPECSAAPLRPLHRLSDKVMRLNLGVRAAANSRSHFRREIASWSGGHLATKMAASICFVPFRYSRKRL